MRQKYIISYTHTNGKFWGVFTRCAGSLCEALQHLHNARPETKHETVISFRTVPTH